MPVGLLKDITKNCPQGVTLLGLDVGKTTIGLAMGDVELCIATPLHTIKRTKFTQDMQALAKVIEDYDIGGFVIGLPFNMDGSEGPRAQSVRDFALEMDRALGSKEWIALWDERLSTVSVEHIVDKFVEKRKTKTNSKSSGLIDKLAAQVILQGALEFLTKPH